MTQKPFQLSRGCSIALVSSWALIFLIGACVFRFSQLPYDLGKGLGRGGIIANILVSAKPGHREELTIVDDGTAILSYPDQPGIFNRAPEIALTAEEWRAFNIAYQDWCATPPRRTDQPNVPIYMMGFSCGKTFGRYIMIPESGVPPILLHLFKRAVTNQA
jgi:hypothetical protein